MIMRMYRLSTNDIAIHNEHIDSYSGQSNLRLTAEINGVVVGWVDYVIFGDEVSISYVEVDEKHKRHGIASKLLKELQKMFPGKELQTGMFTEEGHKLWESLDKDVVQNDSYRELIKRKQKLETEQAELMRMIENVPKFEEQTDEDKQVVLTIGNRLNEISDELYTIDETIKDFKPESVFIK